MRSCSYENPLRAREDRRKLDATENAYLRVLAGMKRSDGKIHVIDRRKYMERTWSILHLIIICPCLHLPYKFSSAFKFRLSSVSRAHEMPQQNIRTK
jgi:hypothetical protein